MKHESNLNNEQNYIIKLPDGRLVNMNIENLPGSSSKEYENKISQSTNAAEVK